MATVTVALGERSYDVEVVHQGLARLGASVARAVEARRCILVSDSEVWPRWGGAAEASLEESGFAVSRIVLSAGEANKNIQTWASLVGQILALEPDRRTPVIALGGGVVGDIAGFAAAACLRGLPLVQVPTTLLAMVDSSVGGKTGVNHPLGKNLVGAFHQPVLVHADVDTLRTLPTRELRAGLAEVVKTAVIDDAALFGWLGEHAAQLADGESAALTHIVCACVAAKARVVAADEREGGLREVLNLGHTVAHGLEAVLGYGVLRHGEAVAIGLVQEAKWAEREGYCAPGVAASIAGLLADLGLSTEVPPVGLDEVVTAMRSDKKGRGEVVRVPIPAEIGTVRRMEVSKARLHELLA